MAYLEHLKNIYSKAHKDRLEDFLNTECRLLISEMITIDFEKIKKHIERNFQDSMFFADPFNENDVKTVAIELKEVLLKTESNDITKYFTHSRYNSIFEKYLNNDHPDIISYNIESCILRLEPFQNLKKDIEKELDGLEFDLGLNISLKKNKSNNYYISSIKIEPYVKFECDFDCNTDYEDSD